MPHACLKLEVLCILVLVSNPPERGLFTVTCAGQQEEVGCSLEAADMGLSCACRMHGDHTGHRQAMYATAMLATTWRRLWRRLAFSRFRREPESLQPVHSMLCIKVQ